MPPAPDDELPPDDEVDRIVAAWQRERPDLDIEPLTVLSRVTRLARHLDLLRRGSFAEHDLEPWEFDVLAALAAHPRMVFTRVQLIEAVWGGAWIGDEHLVDVHVGHVPRKLGDDSGAPVFIRTVRGVGYRMGPGE